MAIEKIIWQPIFRDDSYNFDLLLDRNFAKEMLSIKADRELKKKIKKIGHDKIDRRGYDGGTPYIFYRSTPFVTQFNLGTTSRRLQVSQREERNPLKVYGRGPIIYRSSLMDSRDNVDSILQLIDSWVRSANMIREHAKNSQ